MTRERIVVFPAAATAETRREIAHRAARRGFRSFLLPPGEDAPVEATEVLELRHDQSLAWRTPSSERIVAAATLGGPEDLARVAALGRERHGVVVSWSDERVIPLENLLADGRGHYPVWVRVDRLRDVPAMLGALEHGADRVVVALEEPAQVDQLEAALDEVRAMAIPWQLVDVESVRPAGIGDRVIVDTTSLLRPTEGMLLGSSAAFLFHVASEAVGSRFTRPRPFRVNAGAAHSYALLADGTTRYLAELVAGDAVLVADPHGAPRSVRVGRIKIERRPMVLVEARVGPRTFTVFLQEAETVRLSGEHSAIATTDLTTKARVFGAAFPPARHLGGVVEESIEER